MTAQTISTIKQEQQQLFEDFKTAVKTIDAPINEAAAIEMFNAFPQFFTNQPETALLMFRITSKAQRNVSMRYIDYDTPHDAFSMAVDAGVITREGHPIEDLMLQTQEKVNMWGYGVDFSSALGFEKIWPFFDPITIDEAHKMPAMPQASHEHLDFYRKWGLLWMDVLALDFRAKTMNVYFPIKMPGHFSPEQLAELITDLGFERPSDQELALCTNNVAVYITYNWESLEPQRVCFTVPIPPHMDVPILDPVFEPFLTDVPLNTDAKGNTVALTFGKDFSYYKLERDYNGRLPQIIMPLITSIPD